jgi:hypothetical protein
MKLKTLAACIATVGAGSFAGGASAIPISGEIGLLGAANGAGASVLVCSAAPCTVATWTGIDFGMFNFFLNTSGDIATLAGASGIASMQDPVSFSAPGTLFTAGNLRFDWSAVSLSSDSTTWGAVFSGTMNQVGPGNYTPTPYTMVFSTQGNGNTWSAQVPVPGTLALLGLGLLGAGLVRKRRAA